MQIFLMATEGGKLTIGFIFWLLMLLWFLSGLFGYWPRYGEAPRPRLVFVGHILLFILFFLIGYEIWGWPIAGK